MQTLQVIQFLRSNVSLQLSNSFGNEESSSLSLTDDDFQLYIDVVLSRDYPNLLGKSNESIPDRYVFPVMLLTKKELYYALATRAASEFDLGADNNNYLKRDQKFQHYLKLIAEIDVEYASYLENGGASGANVLTSTPVVLSDRYYTRFNYENSSEPLVEFKIDNKGANFVELSWDESYVDKFLCYKVYKSDKDIVDLYLTTPSKILDGAVLVCEIKDVFQTKVRVTGLESNTEYYFAIAVCSKTGMVGYSQLNTTTESGDSNA